MEFYPELAKYVTQILKDMDGLGDERRQLLDAVSVYVSNNTDAKLNFICTHNSRRSHLAQIWAHVAAYYYHVKVETYSGGTEGTAFHPNALASLGRAGYSIGNPGGANPKYEIGFSSQQPPLICFSKTYDQEPNPSANFAAIMTCSEADAECPIVVGASDRIRLLYEDPKVADNTPEEQERYDERCHQIATEMFYAFSRVKKEKN